MARRSVLIVALLIGLLAGLSSAFYAGTDVIELTPKNFDKLVLEGPDIWIVEFYAEWCGHCQRLTPEYKKAASQLLGLVKVGAVNADKHRELGARYDVKGFPTIKVFAGEQRSKSGKLSKAVDDYNGQRAAADIVSHMLSRIPNNSRRLRGDALEEFASADRPKVFLFTDKSSTPPMYRSLSLQFRSSMAFAEVHTSEKDVAERFGVRSAPAIVVAVPDADASDSAGLVGHRLVHYNSALKAPEIRAFLKQFAQSDWADWGASASGSGSAKREKTASEPQSQLPRLAGSAIAAEVARAGSRPLIAVVAGASPVLAAVESAARKLGGMSAVYRVEPEQSVLKQFGVRSAPAVLRFTAASGSSSPDASYAGDLADEAALVQFMQGELGDAVEQLHESTLQVWSSMPGLPRVLALTRKAETSPLLRALARDLEGRAVVGEVREATPALQQAMHAQRLPALLLLVREESADEGGAKLKAVEYPGPFVYAALMDWLQRALMEVGGQGAAHDSTDAPTAAVEALPEIASDADFERECVSKGGLCLIMFSDPTDSGHARNVELVRQLTGKLSQSLYHAAWVSSAYPQFAAGFGELPFGFPNIVALSPKHRRWAPLIGSFTAQSIEEFARGVAAGRQKTTVLAALPHVGEFDPSWLSNAPESGDSVEAPVRDEL